MSKVSGHAPVGKWVFNFLSWISVTLLWVISAGLWLFRHSCRLRGWQAGIIALICSACLLLWKARDSFSSGTGFWGLIVTSCNCFQHSSHPKAGQQALFSLLLEMYWETPEERFYVIQQHGIALHRRLTGPCDFNWREEARSTLLKAHFCLYSSVKTKSFVQSQHQACWFSMAVWGTWELQFHSQCMCHKFTQKIGFSCIYRARMLPCIWLYF